MELMTLLVTIQSYLRLLVWSKRILILLFLLNLTVSRTTASEAFIKVTKFQVPTQARVGDTIRLVCYYEISKDQRLYAMKMFKDGNEFYRWLPSDSTRQSFRVDGLTIEFVPSKPLEVLLKDVEYKTAGRYKCMITVEGTFKSISQEKDLKVLNRTNSMQLPTMNEAGLQIVGSGGIPKNWQQHQKHAVQMRKQQQQQQQQQKFAPRGHMMSTSPVQEGQQGSSAAARGPINSSLQFDGVAIQLVYMSTLMMISLYCFNQLHEFPNTRNMLPTNRASHRPLYK